MSKKHRNHKSMQNNTDFEDVIIKDSEAEELVNNNETHTKDNSTESNNEDKKVTSEKPEKELEKENNAHEHQKEHKITIERPNKEAEYLELAQRIKAEFDNYKRRNSELSKTSFDNGVVHTIEKFLPVVDSFKQAKASISDENTLKGLDLIMSQINKAFEDLGVTKIKAEGEKFDPNYHNAVLVGKDEEKEDGVILQELQEGFIYKDEKVIRHSVVQINKLD